MTKFTTATEAIPYIGQPCLIFDSLENKPPVEAYIEGVDIVDNKIIAERANFEPHQIAIPIENYEHNLVGLAFYDLKGDIEKYIGQGNQESLDNFIIEQAAKQVMKNEFKNQLHNKSLSERLDKDNNEIACAIKYIEKTIRAIKEENDMCKIEVTINKITPPKEIEINIDLGAE